MKSMGAFIFVLLGISLVSCQTQNFQASLNGAADGVNTATTGSFATNCTTEMCDYSLKVSSIEDLLQAHIHIGNSSTNGPPVVFLLQPSQPAITIDGIGTIAGSFNSTNFINNLTGMPFNTILSGMGSSNMYVNVHTTQYPDGLIRGQTSSSGTTTATSG